LIPITRMRGNRILLSIISLFLVVLIVGCATDTSDSKDEDSLVTGGKKEFHRSNQNITVLNEEQYWYSGVNPDEYVSYSFDIPSSSTLLIACFSDEVTDIYVLSEEEFVKFKNGEEFEALYSEEHTKQFGRFDSDFKGFFFDEGSYVIVIEPHVSWQRALYRLEIKKKE